MRKMRRKEPTGSTRRPTRADRARTRILVDGKPIRSASRPAGTVRELLVGLGIHPQEALVRLDGQMRPLEAPLAGAKRIEIIRVVFGG